MFYPNCSEAFAWFCIALLPMKPVCGPSWGLCQVSFWTLRCLDIEVLNSASPDLCLVAPPLSFLRAREPRDRAVDGRQAFSLSLLRIMTSVFQLCRLDRCHHYQDDLKGFLKSDPCGQFPSILLPSEVWIFFRNMRFLASFFDWGDICLFHKKCDFLGQDCLCFVFDLPDPFDIWYCCLWALRGSDSVCCCECDRGRLFRRCGFIARAPQIVVLFKREALLSQLLVPLVKHVATTTLEAAISFVVVVLFRGGIIAPTHFVGKTVLKSHGVSLVKFALPRRSLKPQIFSFLFSFCSRCGLYWCVCFPIEFATEFKPSTCSRRYGLESFNVSQPYFLCNQQMPPYSKG